MTRPRRVALVVTRFQAGAGVVALRGALALDPERYEHTIIAGRGDHLLGQAEAAGMTVRLRPELVPDIDPRRELTAVRTITRDLREGGFDVVHTHSAKAGAIGRLAARRARVPHVVHTFHGFPWHEFQSGPRRAAYVAIERRLGRITDAFLAVGTSVAAEAIRRGIARPEGIWSVSSTLDAPARVATAATRRAARDLLGIGGDVPVVGTVGRLDHQKAPEDFVEAIAASARRDLVGVWIGGGPLREAAMARAHALGVDARVRFVGQRSDVADVLPAFDVFAMSSLYEGLPCAVLEAMACGLPVVATAVNAVPDVVIPGVTGLLVPPHAPAALAGAIDHLLREPARANALARAARAAARDRTDISGLADALVHAYAPRPRTTRTPDVIHPEETVHPTAQGELSWQPQ